MTALRAVDAASSGSTDADTAVDAAFASQPEIEKGRWPHALSHEPMLRVSDVLQQLGNEFPALTPSKLRFLDSNGLVSPPRTPSGYRQYSPADVERLRFVLREQRDHFRPLSVIAGHLDALDSGRMHLAVSPHAVEDTATYVTAEELAQSAAVAESVVAVLEAEGVIQQSVPGRFERSSVPLVVAGGAYLGAGGDPRSLKALVRAAGREAELVRNAAAPARSRGNDSTADAVISARADASVAVFSACVHAQIDR